MPANHRIAADPQQKALAEAKENLPDISDVDLVDQLERCKEILRREVSNLLKLSMAGKLKVRESESLVQYTKLLNQLVKEEETRANESKS